MRRWQDGDGPRNPPRPLADAAMAVWGTRQVLRGQWNGRAVSIGELPARRYQFRQETDDDGTAIERGPVDDVVELEVLHHQHVAGLEVHEVLAHLHVDGAGDRAEHLELLVPRDALREAPGPVVEQADGQGELAWKRQPVPAARVELTADVVGLERLPEPGPTSRCHARWLHGASWTAQSGPERMDASTRGERRWAPAARLDRARDGDRRGGASSATDSRATSVARAASGRER